MDAMDKYDNKLRILFISSDKYPFFRPAAGVIFSKELSSRGHVIDWLVQAESSCEKSFSIPIGNGHAYIAATNDGTSRWLRFMKHLSGFANDCRMFSMVTKNRYDLIQVKDKYISAVLALVWAKIFGIKYFFWLAFPHAESQLYGARQGIVRYRKFYFMRGCFYKFLLYRIILPGSDHIFVQSEQMKRDIMREGIADSKMTAVPGSVNLSQIPYVGPGDKRSAVKTSEELRVLYLGTLNRMRRLDFLVRAFGKILADVPNAKLYVLGKGDMVEDEEALKLEVSRLGLENAVVFTGYLPMEEAWNYIKKSDVCVSPYYPTPILNSTSPTKLIEYMAMAKPVVGNDHPEQKLVITESGAGFCTPWDEGAFADAIITILTNPEMAKEMGIKGRSYVEKKRTNSLMADVVEEKYLRICKGFHDAPDLNQ